ncbi:MAG: HAD hydrolase family protein [Pseudohongiellaceae bacterium]
MEVLTDPLDARRRASGIRLLALDVDGVLTAGELLYTSNGEEIKVFNILDGLGVKLLQDHGIEVAIISGRQSPMLKRRADELGIQRLIQGREDKRTALLALAADCGVALEYTAYAGDDLPDLAAVRDAGLGITVPNAHPALRRHARLCTERRGGEGAVREIADYLLDAQDHLESAIAAWL